MNNEIKTKVVVIGSGPGGYSAAFRCSDLGLKTVLVERYSSLGGVCLNVGCIPSKILLHLAKILKNSKDISNSGIFFKKPKIDLNKIRFWKNNIITKISKSIKSMAKIRKIKIINGYGKFINSKNLIVKNKDVITKITFDNAIIAVGSKPIKLPFIPYDDPRIWDSTDALSFYLIPKRLLIIGGGIIGLEIATIYSSFGTEIDIVEECNQVIPIADEDIINIYTKIINKSFNILLESKVTLLEPKNDGIYVSIKNKNKYLNTKCYDIVLITIGRKPNSKFLDIEKIGIKLDKKGFISVNKQMRTNISNIFAIGDVIGQPMLAHKGSYEGHIAAEVISGKNHYFDTKIIPSIAYTEPEIAWVGLTEKKAKEQGIKYEIVNYPWTASGRAIASNCQDGITKLIFNKKNNLIIGGSIVGTNGGELLGEISLAIEMCCEAEDIALTIHAHPTLYESISLSTEIYTGTITDLINFKKKYNHLVK